MPIVKRSIATAILILAALGTVARGQAASDYPNRSLRLIIPFAVGGAVTFLTESIMRDLEGELGQSIIRDYRGGAGGTLAIEAAASAPPDGYTLFIVSTSQAISAGVYPNLKADIVKSFTPVTLLALTPYVLVINPAIPAANVSELINYARTNPGKLVLGTSGSGNSDDIIGQEFERQARIEMLHVPYRGAGPVIPDLLTGRVNVTFFSPLPTRAYVEDGKLRLLGVTSKQRSRAMPDVPTIAEQGVPTFDFAGWYGLAVPAGTPPQIVARLQRATATTLGKPDVVKFLTENGLSPGGGSSVEFGELLASEADRWSALARTMGAKRE
jgi:tripartite-type tricarboxylate transporter receptor subunit TctC